MDETEARAMVLKYPQLSEEELVVAALDELKR
jgi:hypothetical protein